MKKAILFFALAGILAGCKETGDSASEATITTPEVAQQTTLSNEVAKEGHGKVTLQCGSQTLLVEGKCGGDTSLGDMIVAVQDAKIPAKVFTITFNGKDYPQTGKTYTVKKSDYMSEDKKPDNEVYIGFSQITQNTQFDWSSTDQTGTVKFESKGNEMHCTFSNLKLEPSAMYNKGELSAVGTVSGEMTFYKN